MKITNISQAVKNPDRVNISVDGKYRFSLDFYQVGELGIKVGKEYTEEELIELETESQFGKLYARALEYCLMRPHSAKEVRDYLWRKTLTKKILQNKSNSRPTSRTYSQSKGLTLNRGDNSENQIIEKPGVSKENAERVFNRLVERGYINDESFARYWIENRNQTKGTSLRKLQNELRGKGVETSVIESILHESVRNDEDELAKVITKKRRKYPDDQKFTQYLMRQGFRYDDIKSALNQSD